MEQNIKLSELIFFIPARSGSTRIKNKNLKNFKGKTLLENKINICKKTKIGDVIVSTDSQKIANIAKRSGAIILGLRPKKLSTSKSSMISSILYTLKEIKKKKIKCPKYIAITPITNPLLERKTIINVSKKLKKFKKFNSITSICKSSVDPFNLIKNTKNKIKFDIFKYKNKSFRSFERSQDKPTFFKITSSIQITKTSYFKKFEKNNISSINEKPIDIKSCTFYETSYLESFDINKKKDLIFLKLFENNKNKFKNIIEQNS